MMIKKIYFLYGSDYSAITARIKEIKEQIANNLTVQNYVLSKLDDIELFFNQSSGFSLFRDSSVEIIDLNLRAFSQLEKRLKEFVCFIKDISAYKFIIIFLHVEKPDKVTLKKISDSELFKELKSLAVFNEFNKLMPWQTEQIKEKVITDSKKYNLIFNQKALGLYIDHIKDNLNNLEQELKTIQLYLLPDSEVNEKCINTLFYTAVNIDNFFDSILDCKPTSVLKLSSLLDKFDSPLYIIAALQNKFRQTLSVKTHLELNTNIYQISKLLGINPYKLEKDIGKIKNISSVFLINIISNLSDLELKAKTGLVSNKNVIDLLYLKFFQRDHLYSM
ncbi:MAG: hypothetical protein A3F80_07195 [Candidatus Melainabacteria bacterium RIFCSPLOWO2_12_FULL_35_11]|nr:MAG: hypothetical protein A3F80_07195 [Candidatus Melainabacteria bacterium RIFCSPLOWO2_12_FULL_35_11]